MANDRARELERVYQMRRGHVPQISISDDNHHVTEAIGDLYGGDSDTEPSRRNSRPLSFIPSPNGDSIQSFGAFEPFDPFPAAPPARSPLRPQMAASSPPDPPAGSSSHGEGTPSSIAVPANKRTSFSHHGSPHSHGPLSPPLSRTNSDTASQQFPLNDLDYESSPAGLAQELSNLQAIRRMSMGVNNADPDLPSFKSNGPPSPPALSDDDDPAKLFWVPARLHPELAPMEFKTFIEDKVNTIRRRSGDSDSLSPDGALGRQSSGGGLRRKKSMLSRQIDSGSGYKDGAERLERQRSIHQPNGGLSDLQELEHIHEDSTELVRQMSLSGKGTSGDGEVGAEGDLSIAPSKFGGLGTLKRSTRTTYRRGSLRKGGPPLSRRLMTGRQGDTDTEESPSTSPTRTSMPEVPPLPLSRVQSEPVNGQFEGPSNFSRPRRRSPPDSHRPGSAEGTRPASSEQTTEEKSRPQQKAFHSRIASNGRTSAHLPGYKPPTLASPVPQIIETPPPQEPDRRQQQFLPPERHSSRQPPPPQQQPNGPRNFQQPPPNQQHQQRQPSNSRQNRHAQAAQNSPIKAAQSFDDLVQHPTPLPGNTTRTDNLSIIPNLPEEKKSDKKTKDKKDGSEGSRKTSWGWLTGGDKDKEKDKKEKEKDKDNKEERDKELAKKVKNKLSKSQDKSHDDTRLDVLQTSIQGSGRGRESLVLDREGVKLEEERKKESNRKSSSDGKKEKEPGLLSSIFGGGKKKGDKETSQKKASLRGLSPEPPPKPKIPDVDYNWTRFSILEERAIYRMAHIKLANPRRELYSQVLLSNFMYSYLAKVQQMHPQIQIGNSKQARQAQQQQAAQQKKEQEQQQPQALPQQQQDQPQQRQSRAQQSQQQPDEFAQYQRYQQQQDQSDKNDWPSSQQQQNNAGSRQPQENGHHVQRDQYGNPYDQNPRDSHHSQHNANGGSGNGYSVANTQNYLGQGSKHGYTYSDSDQSSRADDDMW
ncbi:hypothetical protein HBI56_051200 [Parastagonospora nodorum]|nr:hypothetical protein HBH53_180500 [Parastagonospora nodorum]KAH4070404.1 hypothetical protein HBH50_098490 [Parastagonospora nodorum]KAH4090968.1 hypothetical protein HBH48_102270 [Parastagonospora nodorum]KAH4132974.1 hypothetical protein HBH47_000460 [Parastagonospora nodorum]KAH4159738.1 hypothetical protein HBH43_183510 [Parastagonospora nodorum]